MKSLDRYLPLILIILSLLVALPVLSYPLGRDQAVYATVANNIRDGGLPYLDMWEQKPPPIFYIYASSMTLFGANVTAVRLLDFIAVFFTGLALYWLGTRWANRRVGLLAIVLFAVFYFTETFASLSQSDSLVLLPMTLAIVALVKGNDHPLNSTQASRWAFLVGGLSAFILWFKHYYTFFVLALVIHQLLTRRTFAIKEALAFAIGGLIIGGIPLLYFASNGIVEQLLINAESGTRYVAIGGDTASIFNSLGHYLGFRWSHWGMLLILAGVFPIVWWIGHRHLKFDTNWRLAFLWLLAGLAFALIQGKGFDTHWLPMLPPLVLFGAYSLESILSRLTRNHTTLRLATYGLVILLFWGLVARVTWGRALPYYLGQETLSDFYAKFQANDVKPDESLAMVNYLQDHLAEGDYLYIWGYRPEIYFLGHWRPASRFPMHTALVGDIYPNEWRAENIAWLEQTQPQYVLVLQADLLAMGAGDRT